MEDFIKLYQSMGMVANLIQIAIAVLTIVSLWMVFSKAGEGGWKIFIPKFSYTTDNAAMIAIAGYFKYQDKQYCPMDAPAYSRVTL